ncbi:MAG: DUF4198 domain-containing protein [Pseudomonadota bacterium]
MKLNHSTKLKRSLRSAALLSLSAVVAAPAFAHTSYLKPTTFSTTRGNMVTLQCSFTENFSNPEIAVKSQDFHYYTPSGERRDYDNIVTLRQITLLEQAIEEEGTYRFSTGERLGRKGTILVLRDRTEKRLFGEAAKNPEVPEGGKIVTTQTATVADVYVTKGAPTDGATNVDIGRLVLRPAVHPNEIYLDEPLEVTVSFDGQLLKDQTMSLYREAGEFDADKGKSELKTDANGVVTIPFQEAGVYLLYTRHKADAPAGSETDRRSYTTSLTFEVTP